MAQQYANQYSTYYRSSGQPSGHSSEQPPTPPVQSGRDWPREVRHYPSQPQAVTLQEPYPAQPIDQYSADYLGHPASPPMPSQRSASPFYPPQRERLAYYSPSPTPTDQAINPERHPAPSVLSPVQPGATAHGGYAEPMPNQRPGVKPRAASYFLAGGSISMLAMMALVVFPSQQQANVETGPAMCQEVVKEDARLSRSALSQVLAVAERSPKEKITELLSDPYCVLEPLAVREGVNARREAYPLEFDIDTWFVVLYEEGEYAGYDFSFRNQ